MNNNGTLIKKKIKELITNKTNKCKSSRNLEQLPSFFSNDTGNVNV